MTLSNKQKEKISIEVIKTLVTRFDSFPENTLNNRNAPFHEAFLNAFSDKLVGKVTDTPFLISLSSWLHGLNTTLGQTFFEKVAHHLCEGEKREYTSKKLGNLCVTKTQKENISNIITDLSNDSVKANLEEENKMLFENFDSTLVSAIDFSADVFIVDSDTITAIELKSVRPNSGEMRGEKQKILEGKAALFREFPDKHIKFYIGFPFDPTVDPLKDQVTAFDKTRFLNSIINMTKYFDSEETLVAGELWDFLSGNQNTMNEILDIINSIATTSFENKFRYLTDNTNRIKPNYRNLLEEWNLLSEVELIDNNVLILSEIENDRTLTRIYNNTMLDSKGNYNFDRYSALRRLV